MRRRLALWQTEMLLVSSNSQNGENWENEETGDNSDSPPAPSSVETDSPSSLRKTRLGRWKENLKFAIAAEIEETDEARDQRIGKWRSKLQFSRPAEENPLTESRGPSERPGRWRDNLKFVKPAPESPVAPVPAAMSPAAPPQVPPTPAELSPPSVVPQPSQIARPDPGLPAENSQAHIQAPSNAATAAAGTTPEMVQRSPFPTTGLQNPDSQLPFSDSAMHQKAPTPYQQPSHIPSVSPATSGPLSYDAPLQVTAPIPDVPSLATPVVTASQQLGSETTLSQPGSAPGQIADPAITGSATSELAPSQVDHPEGTMEDLAPPLAPTPSFLAAFVAEQAASVVTPQAQTQTEGPLPLEPQVAPEHPEPAATTESRPSAQSSAPSASLGPTSRRPSALPRPSGQVYAPPKPPVALPLEVPSSQPGPAEPQAVAQVDSPAPTQHSPVQSPRLQPPKIESDSPANKPSTTIEASKERTGRPAPTIPPPPKAPPPKVIPSPSEPELELTNTVPVDSPTAKSSTVSSTNYQSSKAVGKTKFHKPPTGKPTPPKKSGGSKAATAAANLQELSVFTRQFATMIQAGVTIHSALIFFAESRQKNSLEPVIDGVASRVSNGSKLSDAMRGYPEVFSPVYVGLVSTAEVSSKLDETLIRLADLLENQEKLRQKLISTLTYPAFLCGASLAAIALFVYYILPMMSSLYDGMNLTLPWPTRVLLFSRYVIPWVTLVAVGGLLGYRLFGGMIRRWFRRQTRLRRLVHGWLLSSPVLGGVLEKMAISRVLYSFSAMLESGLSFNEALHRCSAVAGNLIISDRLDQARIDLVDGLTIHECFQKNNVFPRACVQMLAVGEESASLDTMITYAARFYDSEVENSLQKFAALIEPTIMAGMGIFVGFIVLSAVLPTVKLIESF